MSEFCNLRRSCGEHHSGARDVGNHPAPLWKAPATSVSGPKSLGWHEWGQSKARPRNPAISTLMALLVTELPLKSQCHQFYCLLWSISFFHLLGSGPGWTKVGYAALLGEGAWTELSFCSDPACSTARHSIRKGRDLRELMKLIVGPQGQLHSILGCAWYLCQPREVLWD